MGRLRRRDQETHHDGKSMTFSVSSGGTSGDLAADRRYQWGLGAAESGDFDGARDLFNQALELAPAWAPGWFALAQALEALGRRAEAVEAYSKTLAFDSGDALGAGLRLATLGACAVPATAPRAYVQALFDQYAAKFDRHLVEKLAYRGPQILVDAVERAAPRQIFAHMLDLGCGAGLAGAAFRQKARLRTGIDLSPAMIEQARAKNIYGRLAAADLVEFLTCEPAGSVDLAIAADVFVYIGDLDPVFSAAARVLTRGGLLAFTAQSFDGDGFRIGDDMRYAHGRDGLISCAERNGFSVAEISAASTRKDRGVDVPGWVAVLRKG
jgi:predicted TPR repeat methyltransferase